MSEFTQTVGLIPKVGEGLALGGLMALLPVVMIIIVGQVMIKAVK